MIYQQELKETNSFFEKYKDKKIVYSKEVTQSIGLVQKDNILKIGNNSVKVALISSTMENLVVMGKLDESLKQSIYDLKGSLSIQLKFISKETGKPLLFTVYTKFLNMNNQGLNQKDLLFITMQVRRKISNELIRIFGLHLSTNKIPAVVKARKVECLLVSNDSKKDCIPQKISKGELLLIIDKDQPISVNQKAMAIMKIIQTGEVIEIIGSISSDIDDLDGKYHAKLKFSMDDQGPRFNYTIHVLKTLINS